MKDDKDGLPPKGPNASAWVLALTGGLELVIAVLGGVVLGQWADKKFHSFPLFLACGTLCGMAVGLYQIIQVSKRK